MPSAQLATGGIDAGGATVGAADPLGTAVAAAVGVAVGAAVGVAVGAAVGVAVGAADGLAEGDGAAVGVALGVADGAALGLGAGWDRGWTDQRHEHVTAEIRQRECLPARFDPSDPLQGGQERRLLVQDILRAGHLGRRERTDPDHVAVRACRSPGTCCSHSTR